MHRGIQLAILVVLPLASVSATETATSIRYDSVMLVAGDTAITREGSAYSLTDSQQLWASGFSIGEQGTYKESFDRLPRISLAAGVLLMSSLEPNSWGFLNSGIRATSLQRGDVLWSQPTSAWLADDTGVYTAQYRIVEERTGPHSGRLVTQWFRAAAFDPVEGGLLWEAPFVGLPLAIGTSGVTYHTDDGNLTFLNKANGTVRWQTAIPGLSRAFIGEVVVVLTDDGHVIGLSAEAGELLWRARGGDIVYDGGATFFVDTVDGWRGMDAHSGRSADITTSRVGELAVGDLRILSRGAEVFAANPETGAVVGRILHPVMAIGSNRLLRPSTDGLATVVTSPFASLVHRPVGIRDVGFLPASPEPGDEVSVSVYLVNSNPYQSSTELFLRVDNRSLETINVSVPGNASRTHFFPTFVAHDDHAYWVEVTTADGLRSAAGLVIGEPTDSAPRAVNGSWTDGAVVLTWESPTTPPGPHPLRYHVLRATNESGEASIGSTEFSTMIDPSVEPGETYRYRVQAVSTLTGEPSAPIWIAVPKPSSAPAEPSPAPFGDAEDTSRSMSNATRASPRLTPSTPPGDDAPEPAADAEVGLLPAPVASDPRRVPGVSVPISILALIAESLRRRRVS